jgi:hypothetical protein
MAMVNGWHALCNGPPARGGSSLNVEALPMSGANVPSNTDVTRDDAEGGCRVLRRAKADVEKAASVCRGCNEIATPTAVAAVATARGLLLGFSGFIGVVVQCRGVCVLCN